MNAEQTNTRCVRHRRDAFTLVEMLVALLLTGIVLSAAGRITVSVLRSEQTTSRTLRKNLQRSVAMDAFASDWDARIADTHVVDVVLDASIRPVIKIIALDVVVDVNGISMRLPTRVTYHVELDDRTHGALKLVRDVEPLSGHGPVQTETVGCDLDAVELLVLRDGVWQPPTPPKRQDDARVDAIRVSLVWSDGETQNRLFLVEGGL